MQGFAGGAKYLLCGKISPQPVKQNSNRRFVVWRPVFLAGSEPEGVSGLQTLRCCSQGWTHYRAGSHRPIDSIPRLADRNKYASENAIEAIEMARWA